MNRPDRDIDERIDAHLRLFAAAPADEVEQAQERTWARLPAEARVATGHSENQTGMPWRSSLALVVAVAAVFVLTIQGPVLWQALQTTSLPPVAEFANGSPSHVSAVAFADGNPIAVGAVLRSSAVPGEQLVLADGSEVEMRSGSELFFETGADGVAIHLNTGSVIVHAARQRHGHLYVKTRDVTVAVVGTVFLVNAEKDGSSVAVIEGEVHVREEKGEISLRPGQQVSTSQKPVRPVKEEIAWSRNSDALAKILDSFTKGMAATAGPLTPVSERRREEPAAGQGGAAAGGPEFDEASIRPCDPDNIPEPPAGARGGGPNSFQMTPGRTHVLCMTLATIIRTAYGYATPDVFDNAGRRARGFNFTNVYGLGVEDGRRVRGGADWVRRERYTIDAIAAETSDAATMSGPMLRALLEKRFRLQAHIETEQIPAYDLTIAPGGFKLKEGTCTPPETPPDPRQGGSSMNVVHKNLEAARRGTTTSAPCGVAVAMNGPNALTVAAGGSLPLLGGFLGVPVTDRTGISTTARFNYALEFALDDTMTGPLVRTLKGAIPGPNVQIASDPSSVPAAPNLFSALEQQLGLRLVPARLPSEFIVIDRVERPAAN